MSAGAQLAMERGDTDLDALHLLLAATRLEPTRQWLDRAGVSPDSIARELERGLRRGEPTGRAPSLTPAAKRALLDGQQVARSVRSSYIGPAEHETDAALARRFQPVLVPSRAARTPVAILHR